MTTSETRIYNRLHDFHSELNKLAKIADQNYIEGGMSWHAEFVKNGAKYVKIDSVSVIKQPTLELIANLDQRINECSILLWYVYGCPPDPMAHSGDMAIRPHETKLFEIQARDFLEKISPRTGIEKSYLKFVIDEASSISIDFVFISGKHALVHKGLWSVD
jgi:hypothetical protein